MVYRDESRRCSYARANNQQTIEQDIEAQQNFGNKHGRELTARYTMLLCHKNIMVTGSVLKEKYAGKPQLSEEEIESVRAASTRNPRQSVHLQGFYAVTNTSFHYS